jgi:hypothetical protein
MEELARLRRELLQTVLEHKAKGTEEVLPSVVGSIFVSVGRFAPTESEQANVSVRSAEPPILYRRRAKNVQ